MKKQELLENIKKVEITYDYEETYHNLYNLVIDYMNDTQDFDLDELFTEYVDYDTCEEYVKSQLEIGGLARLGCCIDGINFYGNNLFRINAYGNIEEITREDLECLKDEIIDRLEEE